MKKVLMVGLMAAAVMLTGVVTAQAKGKAAPKNPPQDMTVVGTVEKAGKAFKMTDADGATVILPKGDAAQYVGTKVTVTGTGTSVTKKGKTIKHITKITKIEKADAAAAAAAAPAAPAPAPAAK